jgi:hypothetical protein
LWVASTVIPVDGLWIVAPPAIDAAVDPSIVVSAWASETPPRSPMLSAKICELVVSLS